MPAVSLIDFANHVREPAGPGREIWETPRYRATLQPDFPVAGPNSVTFVRCAPTEAADVVDEARALFATHHLPFMWTLDPDTEPTDFAAHLAAKDVFPDPNGPEAEVMVLSADAVVSSATFVMRDALADAETFRAADAVNAEAFHDPPRQLEAQERRRLNQLAAGNRRVLLATVDGEPAGTAGITLLPPDGALINGGSVRPKFRGRGVYRALVAARLAIARDAGLPGLAVWGGHMSAPILRRLGFETVGWRRFYLDRSTV